MNIPTATCSCLHVFFRFRLVGKLRLDFENNILIGGFNPSKKTLAN